MNQFQAWASDYARAFGFIVTPRGNWVNLTRAGETTECMSVEGVQQACDQVQADIEAEDRRDAEIAERERGLDQILDYREETGL